jgi:hypothetical protein
VAQNDDIIMMSEVAHKERTHGRKMKAFFRYADHSKDHATWINKPMANGTFSIFLQCPKTAGSSALEG